jgi:hypothetical protein
MLNTRQQVLLLDHIIIALASRLAKHLIRGKALEQHLLRHKGGWQLLEHRARGNITPVLDRLRPQITGVKVLNQNGWALRPELPTKQAVLRLKLEV